MKGLNIPVSYTHLDVYKRQVLKIVPDVYLTTGNTFINIGICFDIVFCLTKLAY